LGKFLLTGIPAAPRGVPQIEVTFEIDVNGILQVSAQDKGTGKQQSITISNTGGLSGAEVERMRQEAEEYAEQDLRRIELVDLKNQAENLIYNYESTLSEQGDLIREELKTKIATLKAEFNIACNSPRSSIKEIKEIIEALHQTLLDVGTDVYQHSASEEQGAFDILDEDISEIETELNLLEEEEIKAVVSVQKSVNIESGKDETMFNDYESVD
jgi:molecular chaperone DnaK